MNKSIFILFDLFFNLIVPLVGKVFYCIILWINKYILFRIDTSIRLEAYVGVISILIAVVIFIAELVRDAEKTSEYQKRFIIHNTNIQKTTIASLIILTCYILKQMLGYCAHTSNNNYLVNILYFLIEILLNFYILKSIKDTIKLFKRTIRLNSDSEYYFSEYYVYVKERLKYINQKNISQTTEKYVNNRFDKFIKTNGKYFSINESDKEKSNYTIIKSSKAGVFKCFSTNVLQSINDKIDDLIIKKKEKKLDDSPIVILSVNPGEKLNHGVTIAYLRNDFQSIAGDVQAAVILQDSAPFQDNDLNLILNDLYKFTLDDDNNSFKDNTMIMDFYNYLYEENMNKVLCLAYEYIEKIIANCDDDDLEQNNKIVKILDLLLSIAYKNKDYEYYKKLSDYMYYCYRKQLSKSTDVRQTIYNYTNRAFRYEYHSLKNDNDKVYFDVMMSNVLNVIYDLLENKNYDAICDMFENIYFEHSRFRFDVIDELEDYDIVKLQFTFGFVYSLIILKNKGNFAEEDKDPIKRIIGYIKRDFVDIHDVEDAIYYFKKYFNYHSNVEDKYHNLDFRFINRKYRNSWSGVCIDYMFVLKSFLYLFNISYSNNTIRHTSLISKNEKYYFERLKNLMSDDMLTDNIESFLGIKYNKNAALSKIDLLLDKCNEEEEKYIREHEIPQDRITQFYKLLIKEIKDGNDLINYLKNNKKIKMSSIESTSMFGFNQVIDRDIFFEEVYGIKNLAESYGDAIKTGVSKDYIDTIDKKSIICSKNFKEYITKIDAKENIIITSPFNSRTMDIYDYNSNKIEIDGKKFDVVLDSKAKHIYVMSKKDVPIIQYKSINDKKLKTKNKIYYLVIDCSKNSKVRKDIINSSDWIKEIGDEQMQDTYLRGKCLLQLYLSVETTVDKNAKIIKFECEDDE